MAVSKDQLVWEIGFSLCAQLWLRQFQYYRAAIVQTSINFCWFGTALLLSQYNQGQDPGIFPESFSSFHLCVCVLSWLCACSDMQPFSPWETENAESSQAMWASLSTDCVSLVAHKEAALVSVTSREAQRPAEVVICIMSVTRIFQSI